jgi:hypothetical protein
MALGDVHLGATGDCVLERKESDQMKKPWHQPNLNLLDGGATVQTSDTANGTYHFLAELNLQGDLPEFSEIHANAGEAFGQRYNQAD